MSYWSTTKCLVFNGPPSRLRISRHLDIEWAALWAYGSVPQFSTTLAADLTLWRKSEVECDWISTSDGAEALHPEPLMSPAGIVGLALIEGGNFDIRRSARAGIEAVDGDELRLRVGNLGNMGPGAWVRLVLGVQRPSQLQHDLERTLGDNARPLDFSEGDSPSTRLASLMSNTSRGASSAEFLVEVAKNE